MIHSRKLVFAGLASLALLTTSIFPALARGAVASVSAQGGSAYGQLHGPSFSSIGQVRGRLSDGSGAPYECLGTLSPNHDGVGPWSGYSPTGTIEGVLVPLDAASLPDLEFWGSYAIDEDGDGSFHAYITAPGAGSGGPRELVGSISGRFQDAAEIDRTSLFPIYGDYQGQWLVQ